MNGHIPASLERLLDPDHLRGTLIGAAVFVLAFETFRTVVIERPQTFFSDGWNQDGPTPGADYQREVVSRSRSLFRASLEWHRDRGIVDEADLAKVDVARKSRNQLAHQMAAWVTREGLTADLAVQLGDLVKILNKIETWWIMNFEMALDPDLPEGEVTPENVIPGPVLGLHVLMQVALGLSDDSRAYSDALRKQAAEARQGEAPDVTPS